MNYLRPITAALLLGMAATATAVDATTDEAGFESLFDGQSLTGWVGATDSYEVVEGLLACKPKKYGNLLTRGEYADFVFRFEFKLTPGANNGIGLRTPSKGDPAYVGMESQVLDNTAPRYDKLKPYQRHGSIYGVAAAEVGALRPVGEWNEEEIRCVGREVRITLNGKTIVEIDLDRAAPGGETIDGRKHPGLARKQGHLGLLGHGARVYFRNLRVKVVEPAAPVEEATEAAP